MVKSSPASEPGCWVSRNPFVNQVSFFAMEWAFPQDKDRKGRNPFVNQVSFFFEAERKTARDLKESQSLRKSGQFLSRQMTAEETALCMSQSLRKSGQFLSMKTCTNHSFIVVAIPS